MSASSRIVTVMSCSTTAATTAGLGRAPAVEDDREAMPASRSSMASTRLTTAIASAPAATTIGATGWIPNP